MGRRRARRDGREGGTLLPPIRVLGGVGLGLSEEGALRRCWAACAPSYNPSYNPTTLIQSIQYEQLNTIQYNTACRQTIQKVQYSKL